MNRFIIGLLILTILGLGGLSFVIRQDLLASEGEISRCTPYDLETKDIKGDSFTVVWKTAAECIGFVKYGENLNSIDLAAFDENSFEKNKKHSVTVNELTKDTSYYVLIISEGEVYSVTNTPIRVDTQTGL